MWFTVLIRSRWSGGGPVRARARAGRASYATYVLHPLVLTAIMALFASLALAPELKFLVVAVVAVPVCFLAGYAATRVPGTSKALLLTFQGTLDDHLGQLAWQPALAGQGPPALPAASPPVPAIRTALRARPGRRARRVRNAGRSMIVAVPQRRARGRAAAGLLVVAGLGCLRLRRPAVRPRRTGGRTRTGTRWRARCRRSAR